MKKILLPITAACAFAIGAGCVVPAAHSSGEVGVSGSVSVGTSQSYWVNSYPPEPLYETMTPSPGYGHVWIDGYWHWNGYDWGWQRGTWIRGRSGYVYVSPYYDYTGGRYVYRSGYWSDRSRLPRDSRVRSYRDGRPPTYRPPVRDYRGNTRRPVTRDRPPVRDTRPTRPPTRDTSRPPIRPTTRPTTTTPRPGGTVGPSPRPRPRPSTRPTTTTPRPGGTVDPNPRPRPRPTTRPTTTTPRPGGTVSNPRDNNKPPPKTKPKPRTPPKKPIKTRPDRR